MTVEEFFDQVITVRMREDRSSLDIIDQTLLPGTIKRIHLNTKEEIWEAIKKLRVRGAPAIGAAAAYGIALLASGIAGDQYDAFYGRFKELKDYLASSRPTAVNLFWALNRMEAAVTANKERGVAAIKELLFEEADRIREEDIQISRGIGEIGFGLLKELKKEEQGNRYPDPLQCRHTGHGQVWDSYGSHVYCPGKGMARNSHACLL